LSVNVRELERRARRSLPAPVYDYYAGGSGREQTLRASVKAWRRVPLLPRVLRDLLTGLTADLAHAMALAGAARIADLDGLARSDTPSVRDFFSVCSARPRVDAVRNRGIPWGREDGSPDAPPRRDAGYRCEAADVRGHRFP
jgi:FMN-dependent dehydrogenase